ncbi:MAG: acyl-CoA thioesterase [Bacteroidales bacterium]
MKEYKYTLELKVRDYECDLQGIVNNAVYQNYLEHTRHEFLEENGISFAALHAQGIDPVVSRITIDFKKPLRSGDRFESKLNLRKEGLKFIFEQAIYRKSDGAMNIEAKVETVSLVNGKLTRGTELEYIFGDLL